MNRTGWAAIAVMASLVAGCGSSPPVHYYTLEAPIVTGTTEDADATMIGMGPFRLPEYLRRSRMVTRGAGTEILVNEQARWAEPMDKAIHRVVAVNVDHQLDNVVVVAFPYLETVDMEYAVLGQVERFDSDQNGRVMLIVQWSVIGDDRRSLISPRRSTFETQVSEPGNPERIATAMNQALNLFSEEVANVLGRALSELSESPTHPE